MASAPSSALAPLCLHLSILLPQFLPSLCTLLLQLISPSLQFKSDRCLSGTSEPWSGSDESHKLGSHCKTPATRLPAQTPSFRSTSWNWGCFLIKALVDWARPSRGFEGETLKLHLTGIFKFTKFDQMEHVYCISLWILWW